MSKASAVCLVLIAAVTTVAGAALALDARPRAGEQEQAHEFHRLVGGLGFGPAVDLERCEFSFDPRLCPACANDCGPIPGGIFFCPYHAGSVFEYPSLGQESGVRNQRSEVRRSELVARGFVPPNFGL